MSDNLLARLIAGGVLSISPVVKHFVPQEAVLGASNDLTVAQVVENTMNGYRNSEGNDNSEDRSTTYVSASGRAGRAARRTEERRRKKEEKKSRKGTLDLGVVYGYESIGTKATKGTQTTPAPQLPGGGPGVPFPVNTTTAVDVDALNRNNRFRTERQYVAFDGKYYALSWLYVRGQIGGTQTDFGINNRQGFADTDSSSGTDMIYGFGAGGVIPCVELGNGKVRPVWDFLYRGGKHDGMEIRNTAGGEASVEYTDLSLLLGAEIDLGKWGLQAGTVYHDYQERRKARVGNATSDVEFKGKNPWNMYVGADLELDATKKLKFMLESNGKDNRIGLGYVHRFGGPKKR